MKSLSFQPRFRSALCQRQVQAESSDNGKNKLVGLVLLKNYETGYKWTFDLVETPKAQNAFPHGSHSSSRLHARQQCSFSQTTYNNVLSAYIRGLFSCWLAGCEVTERLGLQSASLANPYFVILQTLCRPLTRALPLQCSSHCLPTITCRASSSWRHVFNRVHLFKAWPIIWSVLSMHFRRMSRNDMLSKARVPRIDEPSV